MFILNLTRLYDLQMTCGSIYCARYLVFWSNILINNEQHKWWHWSVDGMLKVKFCIFIYGLRQFKHFADLEIKFEFIIQHHRLTYKLLYILHTYRMTSRNYYLTDPFFKDQLKESDRGKGIRGSQIIVHQLTYQHQRNDWIQCF